MVDVNGVEYVEEVIGGKKVLVQKEDAFRITLELTRREAEFIYTILAIVGGGGEVDLNHSGAVWFTDYLETFTDEAVRQAHEMSQGTEWEPIYEDGDYDFIDRYITRMEGRK